MLLCLLANLGFAGGGGSVPEEELPRRQQEGGGFSISNLYEQFAEWKKKKALERELEEQRQTLARIEKKLDRVQEKAVGEHPSAGILATLHSLQVQERKVEVRIETLQLNIDNLESVLFALAAQKIKDDDDDDFEEMMMQ